MHFEETNILAVLVNSFLVCAKPGNTIYISKLNIFYIRFVKEGINTRYNLGRFYFKEENLLNVPL